ncbi:aldo/keto reductase [candidate division KSB1 bacterium]
MRYKLLGRSGLRVSELCLGTMTFGTEWNFGVDKPEANKVYDTYLDAGGNFIDTANLYTEGTSEKFIGEFIQSNRESIVLATKYSLRMKMGDPNFSGNHRKNLMQAVDASLKRLNTDYIDLLWLHAWDYMTPVDEVMRALDDLVRQGKVFYIGVSDTPAWIVSQANTMSELMGWSRFVALQIEYSLVQRTVERELLPMARAFELAVTPWAILGAGLLTGKYNKASEDSGPKRMKSDSLRLTDQNLLIAEEVGKIAKETGKSPAQIAINWVRAQKGLIIPILGARTKKHLEDNLACLDFSLDEEHLKRLDMISEVELGFPHDFMKLEHIRNNMYGGTFDLIDNHRE